MKRGILLLLIIILVVPLSLGEMYRTPPAPMSVLVDVEGDSFWVPVGINEDGDVNSLSSDNDNYVRNYLDSDYEDMIFENTGTDLGQFSQVFVSDRDSFENYVKEKDPALKIKPPRCPIVIEVEKDETTGKKKRRPIYAEINPETGVFQKPITPISPRDVKPSLAQLSEGSPCGYQNTINQQPLPEDKPEPVKSPAEMQPAERKVKLIEKGVGIELDPKKGEFEYKDPSTESKVYDQYLSYVPPTLEEKFEIQITGYATAEFEPQEAYVLVLLVDFPDQKSKVSAEEIEEKFFGEGGFGDYFTDQSYGAFDLKGDVISTWFTLPQNMGYYGGDYERNADQMIYDAIAAADPTVDFSRYDSDNDGVIDGFFVVHAGKPDENGGGNGDEIWSHYYQISSTTVDGIKVIDYETVSEESPIGIIAHEFGHYLGLPDFYDTVFDDGQSKGTGEWTVMGYGGYLEPPASLDPWSKSYLGWLDDSIIEEIGTDGYYSLVQDDATAGIRYYLLPLAGDSEYFLMENRHEHELMNGDDASGILIWHVDETVMSQTGTFNGCRGTRWDCNAVNGDHSHKLLDVEEADGKDDLDNDDLGDKKDVWYYGCGTFGGCQPTLFHISSYPDSGAYGAATSDVAIVINSEQSSSMSLGLSLTGALLAEDVEAEEEELDIGSIGKDSETTSSESTTSGASESPESGEDSIIDVVSGKEGRSNTWVFIVIGILALIIIVTAIIIGVSVFKNKEV